MSRSYPQACYGLGVELELEELQMGYSVSALVAGSVSAYCVHPVLPSEDFIS